MKKIAMYLTAALAVISLGACTPTPQKQQQAMMAEMETGGASDKVPDPDVPVLKTVVIYHVNEGEVDQIMDGVETLDADSLAAKMVEFEALPEGTTVLSYEENDGEAVLDISQAPEDLNDKDKQMFFDAVARTFAENLDLTGFKLLVNGESFTGSDEMVSFLPEDTSGGPGVDMK